MIPESVLEASRRFKWEQYKAQKDPLTPEQRAEWNRCAEDKAYWINTYVQIYDPPTKSWIPFDLWPAQSNVLDVIDDNHKTIVLKARQLGLSWLCLADILHGMLFKPIATVLVFSLREEESKELIGEKRLWGMYKRLPDWMKGDDASEDNKTTKTLGNGSSVKAFPGKRGDSYSATYALIDEADLIPDLKDLLESVEPTINAGGKLVLISRVDKKHSESTFKKIYKDARLSKNGWAHVFLPWNVHPGRDQAWYERTLASTLSIDGDTKDAMHAQYPATDEEALARGTTGKIYPAFSYDEGGNVTADAEYVPGYDVEWWIDPGYSNHFCIAFVQQRPFLGHPDHLCVFYEVYINYMGVYDVLQTAVEQSLKMGWSLPSDVYYDPENPQVMVDMSKLRDEKSFLCRIHKAHKDVAQGIRAVRRHIGPDENGLRLLRLHPRCENIITDLSEYYETDTNATLGGDPKPASGQRDHGESAVRYGMTPRLFRSGT
jgi:hypothetical protein